MGFTTGFLGGVTLTYSILYFSLYVHRANRSVQRSLVSQQAALLNSVIEPTPPLPEPPAYEVRRAGLVEELKDRWNSEIERLVRNFQETDWAEKRALLEAQAGIVWSRVKSSESAHEVELRAKELEQKLKDTVARETERVKEVVSHESEKVKDAVSREAGRVKEAVSHETERIRDAVASGTEDAVAAAKDKANETVGREPRLLELR